MAEEAPDERRPAGTAESPPACFEVESPAAGERALRSIDGGAGTATGTVVEVLAAQRETFLDTFDWRIYHDGGSLVARRDGHGFLLRWEGGDGALRRRLHVPGLPEFAGDLPESVFRRTLATVIGVRRLLPQVEVERSGRVVRVLDSAAKTIARVALESGRAGTPGTRGRRKPLVPRLRVLPLRGYDREWQELARRLAAQPGVRPGNDSRLTAALAAVGREPGDYSSKVELRLDPEQPAEQAVRSILRRLLDILRANEDGTRRGLDVEFLHDFRVAVRRTRAVLTQLRTVLPRPDGDRFRREFAWLGRATGRLRDLDVFVQQLPDLSGYLPESARVELHPLEAFLREERREEQQRLARLLGTRRYRELIRAWGGFLDAPSEEASPPDGLRPVREPAGERIERAWRKALDRGASIGPDSPAAELHRLRVDCKKLRYLLEFFSSLYPPDAIEGPIRALKKLQDLLGELNDLSVQQAAIDGCARGMAESGRAPAGTLLAAGRLIEGLRLRQRRSRRRFEQRFRGFSSRQNQERFRRLLSSAEPRT